MMKTFEKGRLYSSRKGISAYRKFKEIWACDKFSIEYRATSNGFDVNLQKRAVNNKQWRTKVTIDVEEWDDFIEKSRNGILAMSILDFIRERIASEKN